MVTVNPTVTANMDMVLLWVLVMVHHQDNHRVLTRVLDPIHRDMDTSHIRHHHEDQAISMAHRAHLDQPHQTMVCHFISRLVKYPFIINTIS